LLQIQVALPLIVRGEQLGSAIHTLATAREQVTRPIVAALYPRRYALKNRERLNRLLMLQQLHVNGEDDVLAYAKTIRAWLESNGDRPANRRCAIVDPTGSPSLRRFSPIRCGSGVQASGRISRAQRAALRSGGSTPRTRTAP
jgi:hypothetical protein